MAKTKQCGNCEEDFPRAEVGRLTDRMFGGTFPVCRACAKDLGREREAGFREEAETS